MSTQTFEITADGDTVIPGQFSETREREKSTVVVLANADTATITLGTGDSQTPFIAYPNGELTSAGVVVNHGAGARLIVRVVGITANPVRLSVG